MSASTLNWASIQNFALMSCSGVEEVGMINAIYLSGSLQGRLSRKIAECPSHEPISSRYLSFPSFDKVALMNSGFANLEEWL